MVRVIPKKEKTDIMCLQVCHGKPHDKKMPKSLH